MLPGIGVAADDETAWNGGCVQAEQEQRLGLEAREPYPRRTFRPVQNQPGQSRYRVRSLIST
jgi:hypothetical protein